MTASQDATPPRRTARRRWWAVVAALGALVLLLLSGTHGWAVSQGYLPRPGGEACSTVGYLDDWTYEEIRADGNSPYCARWQLGENWL